jgi:magnesium-transporting ATPase (P-type)
MEKFIEKLSKYNLFNYLLPGIILGLYLEKMTSYKILDSNPLINIFIFYFIGLIISRVGSIIIETFLKCVDIIKFANYNRYYEAEKNDDKMQELVTDNNMYRTIMALFFTIIITHYINSYNIPSNELAIYVSYFLFFLFLFSFIKQTNYINKRVNGYHETKTMDEKQ